MNKFMIKDIEEIKKLFIEEDLDIYFTGLDGMRAIYGLGRLSNKKYEHIRICLYDDEAYVSTSQRTPNKIGSLEIFYFNNKINVKKRNAFSKDIMNGDPRISLQSIINTFTIEEHHIRECRYYKVDFQSNVKLDIGVKFHYINGNFKIYAEVIDVLDCRIRTGDKKVIITYLLDIITKEINVR